MNVLVLLHSPQRLHADFLARLTDLHGGPVTEEPYTRYGTKNGQGEWEALTSLVNEVSRGNVVLYVEVMLGETKYSFGQLLGEAINRRISYHSFEGMVVDGGLIATWME